VRIFALVGTVAPLHPLDHPVSSTYASQRFSQPYIILTMTFIPVISRPPVVPPSPSANSTRGAHAQAYLPTRAGAPMPQFDAFGQDGCFVAAWLL
jgi:hypothetical protein